MNGKITDIETMGSADGPGVRLVIFLSGCGLRCQYCHNPETWEMSNFKREISPEEVLNLYNKYSVYYGENGGVTFSGGEPLLQSEFLMETAKLLKANNIHIALDTAGAMSDISAELLGLFDLIILDVKSTQEDEYLFITGRKMKLFNNFLDLCQKLNKKLWLRQVIVPGINDDEAHIELLNNFVKDLKNVERVELLPYHSMAKEKYERLGIDYKLKDIADMDKEKCLKLSKLLKF